jgi:hypothetical protein
MNEQINDDIEIKFIQGVYAIKRIAEETKEMRELEPNKVQDEDF